MKTITKATARRIMIAAQGLDCARPAHSMADVVACIERMAILQIDTINVVNRSPYFVLWSRLGAYPATWLDDALAHGDVFEAWVHEACVMPQSWWPYQRRIIRDGDRANLSRWAMRTVNTHHALVTMVRNYLATHAEVRSSDFVRAGKKQGTWWDWSHEKQVLEAMFALGELMVVRRDRFQRVYGLTHVHRPAWRDDDAPSLDAVRMTQMRNTLRTLGVVHERWLGDYYRVGGKYTVEVKSKLPYVARLHDAGEIIPIAVEGIPGTIYLHAPYAHWLDTPPACTHTTLLSPFDPLVWDRLRAQMLFDFAYKIECYTPAAKRMYGYFTLPVLYHDRLVGRVDCKAHRATGVFEVISMHFEPWVAPDVAMYAAIATAIRACAAWHATPQIIVGRVYDDIHREPFLHQVAQSS
ncbi:MAG: hypothetical protein RL076_284 [Chloroflexota bacterium]|jgi:uncharacterized protein YcaQ